MSEFDSRAQWAIDFGYAVQLERIGQEMRVTSLQRRCSFPVSALDGPKCTKDIGHEGNHECNMGRDFDGSAGSGVTQ